MATRSRTAAPPEPAEAEAEETAGGEPVTKDDVREVVREIVSEVLGKTGVNEDTSNASKEEDDTPQSPPAPVSPRQVEADFEGLVARAAADIKREIRHDEEHEKLKREPEVQPGRSNLFTRLIVGDLEKKK
jgi:hypothetical protein